MNLYKHTKALVFSLIALIIGGSIYYFYGLNGNHYDYAIVQGTVQGSFQGHDPFPGFGRAPTWWINITLQKGTFGDMKVIHDTPRCNSTCDDNGSRQDWGYPFKLDGQWNYQIALQCDIFKPGDTIYLKVPLYAGGTIWYQDKAVQGYDYYDLSHNYAYPYPYKEGGLANIGFVPIPEC